MTIIIRPPVGGLDLRDLLLTLNSMRRPGDPAVTTGSGGCVVCEPVALRFLQALLDAVPPDAPQVEVTTWEPPPPPDPPQPQPVIDATPAADREPPPAPPAPSKPRRGRRPAPRIDTGRTR